MGRRSVVSEKRESAGRLAEGRKALGYYLTHPLVQMLARTPVSPNALSCAGALFTAAAAALIIAGQPFIAGLVVLFAGLFDILDGALARSANRITRFGGVLDATLDRLAEGLLLVGILVLYTREQSVPGTLITGLALVGSVLVSYIRAKAEGLGLECQGGWFTRAERVIILSLGLLLSQFQYALMIALSIILIFSFVTAGQRLFHVWQQTK